MEMKNCKYIGNGKFANILETVNCKMKQTQTWNSWIIVELILSIGTFDLLVSKDILGPFGTLNATPATIIRFEANVLFYRLSP